MYVNLFIGARDRLGLDNNAFIFLVNIKNIQDTHKTEWYQAYEGMKKTPFLQSLARYVNIGFTYKGMEGLLKRLEKKGVLELDMYNFRLRVTDKFRAAINQDTQKINEAAIANEEKKGKKTNSKNPNTAPISTAHKLTDEEQQAVDEINALFASCWLPQTESVEVYRQDLEKFVEKVETVGEGAILTAEQATFLKGLALMLRPEPSQKHIADAALRSLHTKRHGQHTEAIEKYGQFSTWQIDAEMSETEYLNKLNSTVIWLSIAKKFKIVEWSTSDQNRLDKAIQFVGRYKNDPNADQTGALAHFRKKKAEFREQTQAAQNDKKAKPVPEVAQILEGVLKSV